MASAVIGEDFKGSGALLGSSPGTLSGVAAAAYAGAAGSQQLIASLVGEQNLVSLILKVQEIRGYEAVTRIANAPDFLSLAESRQAGEGAPIVNTEGYSLSGTARIEVRADENERPPAT